jgi:transposase-like protein
MSKSAIAISRISAIASAQLIQPWVAELRKKRPHCLAFLNYSPSVRKFFCSTNLVEAINGQLEIIRRNGYFDSEDTLKMKLDLAISSLNNGKSSCKRNVCGSTDIYYHPVK